MLAYKATAASLLIGWHMQHSNMMLCLHLVCWTDWELCTLCGTKLVHRHSMKVCCVKQITIRHLYELLSFKLGPAICIDWVTRITFLPVCLTAIIHLNIHLESQKPLCSTSLSSGHLTQRHFHYMDNATASRLQAHCSGTFESGQFDMAILLQTAVAVTISTVQCTSFALRTWCTSTGLVYSYEQEHFIEPIAQQTNMMHCQQGSVQVKTEKVTQLEAYCAGINGAYLIC